MRRQVVARPEAHVAHGTLEGTLVRVNLPERNAQSVLHSIIAHLYRRTRVQTFYRPQQ